MEAVEREPRERERGLLLELVVQVGSESLERTGRGRSPDVFDEAEAFVAQLHVGVEPVFRGRIFKKIVFDPQ